MKHLLELFHSENDDDILDVDLQMIQSWLVVAPSTKFSQYLLCCFIKTEEWMFLSQIACHSFLRFPQPRQLWNWLMEKQDMPKELELFYVAFLTVQLYIQLDQFIIVQVTLPTPSSWVPSNFIYFFKRLHMMQRVKGQS